MRVTCAEGAGTIVAADDGKYNADGVFASWSQEKLRSMYQSLVPSDESRFEILQLG